MSHGNRKSYGQRVFSLTAIVSLATCAWAQPLATIRSVTSFHVKADRVGDFRAAVKEYNAVLKKASYSKGDSMWTSVTGPIEYLRVQYYAKYAEMDASVAQDPKLKEERPDLTRISTRILQCTDRSQRIMEQVLPELSLPPSGEMPKMIRALRILVKPEKVGEFLALQKDDVVPAMKKSGVKVYSIARARAGAPSSEFLVVTGMNSWADMDGKPPLLVGMGEEAYRRFLTKTAAVQVQSEANIYRFQPDLSYQPAGN
jgi:hypothetical protein